MLRQQHFAVGALAKLGNRHELVVVLLQAEALLGEDLGVPPHERQLVEEIDKALLGWRRDQTHGISWILSHMVPLLQVHGALELSKTVHQLLLFGRLGTAEDYCILAKLDHVLLVDPRLCLEEAAPGRVGRNLLIYLICLRRLQKWY